MLRKLWHRIRLGILIAIPLFVVYAVLDTAFSPFIELGSTILGHDIWGAAVGIIFLPILLWTLGTIGYLLSLPKHADTLLEKTPYTRLKRGIKTLQKIKKGGMEYPEVRFPGGWSEGVWKKGILISKYYSDDIGKMEAVVLRPGPLSLGGDPFHIEEDKIKITGRSGWALVKEVVFYGMLFSEIEDDKLDII